MPQLSERTGKIVDKVLYVIFGGIGLVAIFGFIRNIVNGEIPVVPLIVFGVICILCFVILIYRLLTRRKLK
jgi:heme A synthase